MAMTRKAQTSSIHTRDRVKERAADEPSPGACRSRRPTMGVGDERKGLVRSGIEKRRIVEFVALQSRALAAERGVGEKARVAVAELHLRPREARDEGQKPGHGVARA